MGKTREVISLAEGYTMIYHKKKAISVIEFLPKDALDSKTIKIKGKIHGDKLATYNLCNTKKRIKIATASHEEMMKYNGIGWIFYAQISSVAYLIGAIESDAEIELKVKTTPECVYLNDIA